MSWAMYEPVASLAPNAPARMPDQMKPVLQYKPENPAYSASPSPSPQQPPAQGQSQGQTKSRGWADISEYEEINDWVYIFIGILATEVILLFLVRLFPEMFAKYLNISPSMIRSLEQGQRHAHGAILKLLNVVARHGIDALI